MTNLQYIGLRKNLLTGTIPSQLGGMTSLTGVNLAENELTGSIPSQLAALNKLHTLYLFGNHLTGAVPDLPFAQYFIDTDTRMCCIYAQRFTNNFTCPLPGNADSCKCTDMGTTTSGLPRC
jgi:hypothetical protein